MSSPVKIYEYIEINMVRVFAGLQLYVKYDVVNIFIEYDYFDMKAVQENDL